MATAATMAAKSPDFATIFNPSVGSGAVRAALLKRALIVYAGLVLIGALPLVLGLPASLQAAGIGIWFPGAGFLAVGGWGFLGTIVTILAGRC